MILVLDSSPLIALARIDRLSLIPQLAERVYIPMAVYEEVLSEQASRPGAEAEAITLARQVQADFLVLDDAIARRLAEKQGARVIGLLGLLLHAKHRGIIETIKPILDALKSSGFFVDEALFRMLLREADEEA